MGISIGAILMLPTLEENRILRLLDEAKLLGVTVAIQLVTFSLFYLKGVSPAFQDKLWIGQRDWARLDKLVDELILFKKKNPGVLLNSFPAIKYIKRYFRDPHDRSLSCYRSFAGKIWVDANGMVYPCQSMPFIGDLKKDSLKDIVFAQAVKQACISMFQKQCPGCSCDYAFNVDSDIVKTFF